MRRLCIGLIVAALSVFQSAAQASADYIVRPGDVLEVDVVGVNGLRQKLSVDEDGVAHVPLIGGVAVAGKSLDEIKEIISKGLSAKSVHQVLPSGKELDTFIDAAQVWVSIAEYRPIYVLGDVAKPGQQAYRPGITARQALSLAGGLDVLKGQRGDMFIQPADLKADFTVLWIDLARENMRIERIKTELTGATTPPIFSTDNIPLPRDTLDELVKIETKKFQVNAADYKKETEFLHKNIESIVTQAATVKEQQSKERDGLAADMQEHDRIAALETKGMTTSARVTEARRSLLFSSTRYLQTTAQLAQFQKDEADFRRKLEKLDDTRKSELLKELQESIVKSMSTYSRIKSVAEKQRIRGDSPLVQAGPGRATITIIREGANGPVSLLANEEAKLQPGDVVEAALRSTDFLNQKQAHAQ